METSSFVRRLALACIKLRYQRLQQIHFLLSSSATLPLKSHVAFKEEIYAQEDELGELFYIGNSAWRKCLINGSVVEIGVNLFDGFIGIFFESEGAEPWMYTSNQGQLWQGRLVDFQQIKPEMRNFWLLQVENEHYASFLGQVGLGRQISGSTWLISAAVLVQGNVHLATKA